MKSINLTVTGMHCKSCEILIVDALEETFGVVGAVASHEENKVNIEFDENKIALDTLKEVISNEGYLAE